MNIHTMQGLLQDSPRLIRHLQETLTRHMGHNVSDRLTQPAEGKSSAVLLTLTCHRITPRKVPEVCLILNKRSPTVRQPGDLCYPGGGPAKQDRLWAGLLRLPHSPLTKWPAWPAWRLGHKDRVREISMLLATGMREAWEEMRLNPLQVSFLGSLPVQRLVMFDRLIHPMVGWLVPRQRFKTNWEVARIVYIPLRQLLTPQQYGRYRIKIAADDGQTLHSRDFPCFVHRDARGEEVLWGATYRITQDLLRIGFGFNAPAMDRLAVIKGRLDQAYLDGSRWIPNRLPPIEG